MAEQEAEAEPRESAAVAPVDDGPEEDSRFEDPEFNAVQYVNKLFPTEESLSRLSDLTASLESQTARVDARILSAVREQSATGSRARVELAAARRSAAELSARLEEVSRRTRASEALVTELCRDIRRLDAAKRHLVRVITALRRLAMLSKATDALQAAAERGELAQAAQLLSAVTQLQAHFEGLAAFPRVAELRGRAGALAASLRVSALRDFELAGDEAPGEALLARFRAACALVDALGPGARDEAVDALCRREMGVYTQIFGTAGDTARLERTANRYKWVLKRLQARRALWDVFPRPWRVPELLCLTFCQITKTALAEILDLARPQLEQRVDALLKALEATHIFEAELERRFAPAKEAGGPPEGRKGLEAFQAAGGLPESAEEVKARYRNMGLGSGKEPGAVQDPSPASPPASSSTPQSAASAAKFRGAISSAFAPYLSVYVAGVERDLGTALDSMLAAERWSALSPQLALLASANELAEALKTELHDCCARVGRGRVLLDLAAALERVYCAYAARLQARLPRPQGGGPHSQPAVLGGTQWLLPALGDAGAERAEAQGSEGGGSEGQGADGDGSKIKATGYAPTSGQPAPPPGAAPPAPPPPPGEADVACLIASTAAHCQRSARALQQAVRSRLQPPQLAAELPEAEAAADAFQAAQSAALCALVLGLETRLEPGLLALSRADWGRVDAPGDASAYVSEFRAALGGLGPRLRRGLPPACRRFVLDRLVASLGARLRDAVCRTRRISEPGAHQLRIDGDALVSLLLRAARAAGLEARESDVVAAHLAAVWGRIEAELKVVAAPVEAVADTFLELCPEGDAAQLQRLLALKALRRVEAQAVLDDFHRRAAARAQKRARGKQAGGEGVGGAGRGPPESGIEPISGPSPGSNPGRDGASVRRPTSPAPARDLSPPPSLLSPARSAGSLPTTPALTPGSQASSPDPWRRPLPRAPPSLEGPSRGVAAKAQAAAQDVASRFRKSTHVQAARASASAAGDSVRETVERTFGAVKSLRFMQRD